MESLFDFVFWTRVAAKQRQGQRKGQAVFNVAADMFPVETREVNSLYDPFYNDDKISEFLTALVEILTK
jgi:hypothetical protein